MPFRGSPHDDYATTVSPVLYGDGGGFYDRAAKRWVPASPAATLADGSAYAYVTADSRAQIVDVASGTVRTFELKPLDRPAVLDFNTRGVYLYQPSGISAPRGARLARAQRARRGGGWGAGGRVLHAGAAGR